MLIKLSIDGVLIAGEPDNLPELKHWIRNLSKQPDASFWLPTAADRF
ncbi:MAG: hypothetical protein K4571_04570 [Deltaproteobacteria bacterium]